MPYVPVIIAFAQRWDRKAGLGTLIAAMVPYSVLFIFPGLPLGPGAPLEYGAVM